MKKQIPNMFTISRILLVIISFIVLLNKDYKTVMILLLFASLTDFSDGYFARKFNAMSMLGARLDQLSDKLFSSLICLALIILGNHYLILTLFIEVVFSVIVSIQSYRLNQWKESTKHGKIKISLLFITMILGVTILHFKDINIIFIIVWGITLIIQLYANSKIVLNLNNEIKNSKRK